MTEIKNIRKRNGQMAPFEADKITLALQKAFVAVAGAYSEERITEITRDVAKELENIFAAKEPTVEDVQDAVERSLMKRNFFAVAKAYILYRHEHEKTREQVEIVEQDIKEHKIAVIKRDGTKQPFDLSKVQRTLAYCAQGYEDDIDSQKILQLCENDLYDGIKSAEVAQSLILATRSFIEVDPAYSKVAAKLLLNRMYKEVIGPDIDFKNIVQQHKEAFVKRIKDGVDIDRIHEKMLDFDLGKYADMMDLSKDDLFEHMGLEVMYDRYLVRDPQTNLLIETPQMAWMRTALGTAIEEPLDKRDAIIKDFYYVLSEFLYTPGGRTIFHAGTPHPQLSSCFLSTVEDDLSDIFKYYGDAAQMLKWSGGTGTDWTNIRSTGSLIKGTGVGSQGVIPFLKIENDVIVSINRGGKRRGNGAVYLEPWHADVQDFLELRKNTGDERRRTHDLNTANWIPDLFMKRVQQDGTWTLFSPSDVPDLHDLYGAAFDKKYEEYEQQARTGQIKYSKEIKAKDLWKKMLAMLFETGHPWMTFKDACNVRSPQDHDGVVHCSNLCTEITLNTSKDETAVCNLGSLNFARFVVDGKFDNDKVGDVVRIAMRMLDNVIDINFYPTERTRFSNLRHRPLGLGVRGFQDALYALGISFDSDACVQFADESMEAVAYYAILASSEMAKERGAYETYKGSKWDRNIFPQDTLDLLEQERGSKVPVARGGKMDWTPVREHVKQHGMRNSNCMAIAPTASTANLVGCVPTVEPIYKNLYVKSNKSGNFVIMNQTLVQELKTLDLWNDDIRGKIKFYDGSVQGITDIPEDVRAKYKEVFEIDPKWLIKAAAHRGKWMDQSQSLNIFFHGTSGKALSEVYFYAWEMGLKTTYYLRTLGASQVEKSTMDLKKFGDTHKRQDTAGPQAMGTEKGAPIAVPLPQQQPVAEPVPAQSMAKAESPVAENKAKGEYKPSAQAASLSALMQDPDCIGCEG